MESLFLGATLCHTPDPWAPIFIRHWSGMVISFNYWRGRSLATGVDRSKRPFVNRVSTGAMQVDVWVWERVSGHSETESPNTTHENPHGPQESAAKNKLQHENTETKITSDNAKVKNRKRSRRQPKLPTADRPSRVSRVDASPYNVKRAFKTKELQNNPGKLE